MVIYNNVKGVGETKEECKASYTQALIDAEVPGDISRKAALRYSLKKNSDDLWEIRSSLSCFTYGV